MSSITIRRALVSVSDKRGLVEFGKFLAGHGVEILSTGGTARALTEAGIEVVKVSDHTGAPEILDGRVKTLHPKIHGGLLARPTEDHQAQLVEHGIAPIDLVVVNLYPFEQTIAKPDVSLSDAVENIDIGGPSMLRSAAKNHERVAVIVDPADYEPVTAEMAKSGGSISDHTRFCLARTAFAHTAAYDAAIAAYFSSIESLPEDRNVSPERAAFPGTLTIQLERVLELRYGENPHQQAAFYRDSRSPLLIDTWRPSLAAAEVLQGKALSYNNILDLDAALGCCLEFDAPTAVVVKHTNPCGAASSEKGVALAYKLARECDPTSSFGGIVAVNREVDEDLASQLAETFLECVIAPSYSDKSLELLARKKNLRLIQLGEWKRADNDSAWSMRSVSGGLLVQSADTLSKAAREAEVVTDRQPTTEELSALDFAWRVVKHIKSNAILYCTGTRTAAVGAGQMSRVDSARIAKLKAQLPLEGTVAASDAFFPFRDGLDAVADAGATAVIQPGGSVRDQEVIEAANERGLAMIFSGMRHFRH